jgi:hypothetical protein
MTCQRCNTARYCQKSCQTADWKRKDTRSHREVCDELKGSGEASGNSKKSTEKHKRVIECGHVDNSNVRRLTGFSPFFGVQVEIYTAADDPERRILYSASALKDKFGSPITAIDKWNAQHRYDTDGVFEATSFEYEPADLERNGLQAGASFFTLAACRKFGAAFAAGDDAYVMSLIDIGVDPNIVLLDHSSSLFGMCGNGNAEGASALLSNGADPNYASAVGTTLLHVACSGGHFAVAQILIDRNADVRTLDNNLNSALDYAVRAGRDDIVKILKARMETEKWLCIASLLPPNIAPDSVEATDHLIHKESTNLVKEFPSMDVHFQVIYLFLCLPLFFHTHPS